MQAPNVALEDAGVEGAFHADGVAIFVAVGVGLAVAAAVTLMNAGMSAVINNITVIQRGWQLDTEPNGEGTYTIEVTATDPLGATHTQTAEVVVVHEKQLHLSSP